MKSLLRISIAIGCPILLHAGAVIASGGASQTSPAHSVVMISSDESELLQFDENGDVTNLYYPSHIIARTPQVILNPGEAEKAFQAITRVMPRLTNGFNVGLMHHMAIGQRASTHVAAGAFIRRGEQDSTTLTDEDKGVDPMLQLGMTYKLTPGVSVTGEVQRFFKSDDEDLKRYAVGMVYTF